ncbi:hypothetical protein O181_055934 [Austropuccinia psidii MF-1]|uniref:Uncharacterized protein n=1 Tax=Austropuccinia psidii MF-1 TaxID=1389203 RepID=A0A9Q3HV53_9BASI|nr:hypothetical protein [Austropuccinia psidii MF-1]
MTVYTLDIYLKIGNLKNLNLVHGGLIGGKKPFSTLILVIGAKNDNKSTGKGFGHTMQIKEPNSPWEIAHMNLVTALPPAGDKGLSKFIVIVDIYSETPIVFPFHKDDTAMDTSLLIWSKII